MTADLEAETPVAERICARCRWSRTQAGDLFTNEDRAYCGQPDVVADDGGPVACEKQRLAPSSALMKQCGFSAIYFEARR